jgi:hypothetical protein
MPLSTRALRHRSCPHLFGNKNEKLGSYFWRMRRYHCSQCQQPVTLNYDDKLKLFAEHATLAKLGP